MEKYYAILPGDGVLLEKYKNKKKIINQVDKDFVYDSGSNESFLTIDELRKLIRLNIDSSFTPF